MFKKFLSLFIVFAGLFITANAQKVSLIVKFYPKTSGSELQTVASIDFEDGKFIGKRDLFSVNTRVAGNIGGIYSDRYILTNNETIFGWKPENEKAFDLKTGKFVERKTVPFPVKSETESFDLISPDGKKVIKLDGGFGGVDSLRITIAGQKDLVINEMFNVTTKEISSYIPFLPIRWVDNERILTQKRNGSLVVITLDGKVEPFLEIPCSTDGSPYFRLTKAGKLSYICSGEEYRIDLEKKSFARIKRDLDHDFSYEYANSQNILYYKDKNIGEGGLEMETFPGYLAATDGKPGYLGFYDAANINQVKIWNRFTEKWQLVTIDGWHVKILGFITR